MCNMFHLSACPKCVLGKDGLTCCGKGGSWHGKCGRGNDPKSAHTWKEGLEVCSPKAVPVKSIKMVEVSEYDGDQSRQSPQQFVSGSVFVTITIPSVHMVMVVFM